MAWSGLRIYWANPVYVELPDRVYSLLRLDYHLAQGMAVHFFIGWLFVLNGLLYASFTALSGEWRQLLPERASWREAPRVVWQELFSRPHEPEGSRYNAAQRMAYTIAVLAGAGLVATGFAIYKPAQLRPLTALL